MRKYPGKRLTFDSKGSDSLQSSTRSLETWKGSLGICGVSIRLFGRSSLEGDIVCMTY